MLNVIGYLNKYFIILRQIFLLYDFYILFLFRPQVFIQILQDSSVPLSAGEVEREQQEKTKTGKSVGDPTCFFGLIFPFQLLCVSVVSLLLDENFRLSLGKKDP